jgi:crotonobetainyl-CoA:carnitine CoA-transferase CaiB-like acyl-CoA transferase
LSRRPPLEGIRVLAFTHIAAGPYACLQLAALGSEVIKIESATRPDPWRYRDRNHDPEGSRPFADHNKNVRSVTLNLKSGRGRQLALALAERCDIVIDNFSAGVMTRLGLGYADLATVRPDVIVLHLSGLGSTGPRSSYVTFGPSIMAMSGMTQLWTHPDSDVPVGSQSSYPDYLVGGYAAFAALALLIERRRTGRGRELDLTQIEVTLAALGPAVVAVASSLATPRPVGNASDEAAPHGCYPCVNGNDDWCAISVRNDEEWRRFAEVIGRPELAQDPRYATTRDRLENRAALDALVAAWTSRRSAHDVMECCQVAGIPAGPVATGRDLARDPHLLARGFVTDLDHPKMGRHRYPGPPFRLGTDPLPVWRLGPLMGQDNDRILGGLMGLSDDEIRQLQSDGVVR